jgi:hypothetical protein
MVDAANLADDLFGRAFEVRSTLRIEGAFCLDCL